MGYQKVLYCNFSINDARYSIEDRIDKNTCSDVFRSLISAVEESKPGERYDRRWDLNSPAETSIFVNCRDGKTFDVAMWLSTFKVLTKDQQKKLLYDMDCLAGHCCIAPGECASNPIVLWQDEDTGLVYGWFLGGGHINERSIAPGSAI